jgi:hypothetical protein
LPWRDCSRKSRAFASIRANSCTRLFRSVAPQVCLSTRIPSGCSRGRSEVNQPKDRRFSSVRKFTSCTTKVNECHCSPKTLVLECAPHNSPG